MADRLMASCYPAVYVKLQARLTEMQIKEEFKKLHKWLRAEEKNRISALRKEKERKYRMLLDRPRGDAKLGPGALLDVAQHLGNLHFKIWEKMPVSYTPVILDPNTALDGIQVSDDLTTTHWDLFPGEGLDWLRPDNPERFEKWTIVLGSEGFNSGTHSWDVEGNGDSWELGVVEESFDSKRGRPEGKGSKGKKGRKGWKGRKGGRYWGIEFMYGEYKAVSAESNSEPFPMNIKEDQRIRVQLDWDKGQLSFSDPDSGTHLHTFTHTFTERVFPYFDNGGDDGVILKVLPGKVGVTREQVASNWSTTPTSDYAWDSLDTEPEPDSDSGTDSESESEPGKVSAKIKTKAKI